MMRTVKIFSAALAVILTLVLAVALIKNHNREAEIAENALQLDNELRPLYAKISELEISSIALDNDFREKVEGKGTLSLLYTDSSSAVYDVAYPEMSKYGYCGVIALSDASFPGNDGCMSTEQLSELLDAGWKWCVKFSADSASPEADAERLLERADAAGFGRSSIIFFPEGSYSGKYDAWIAAAGFTAVMHHGEEEKEIITEGGTSDGIFYQGVVNWRSVNRRYYLSTAVSECGSMAFEMEIRPDNVGLDAEYQMSMLEVIEKYRSGDDLNVMTPNEANEYHLSVQADSGERSKEWQKRKDEINSELSALWAEIERISRQYDELLTE